MHSLTALRQQSTHEKLASLSMGRAFVGTTTNIVSSHGENVNGSNFPSSIFFQAALSGDPDCEVRIKLLTSFIRNAFQNEHA
jgi:hypothetical protein